MQDTIVRTNHSPEDYDELSTKREMVTLLANDATGEQLDAAMHACIDNRLDDAERRTILIQTIYRSWHERLRKRPRPAGADFAPTWEDVERMFLDILAIVGATRSSPPEPPPQPASSDKRSESEGMTPIARLSVGVPALGGDSAVLEHIRRALDEPPPHPASPAKKSGMAAPIRASLLDWSRPRPIN
jgi:hypothetical protein